MVSVEMRSSMRAAWAATLGVLLAIGTGCVNAPAPTRESVSETIAPGGNGPENSRSLRRRLEFERATAGVTFHDDRIEVTATGEGPDLATAFLDTGDELLERNRVADAIAAYVSAVRAAPEFGEAYRRLGHALAVKKKPDLALLAHRTAVTKDADSAQARVDLAIALSRRKDFKGAITEMDAALALDPTRGDAHRRAATWHYYLDDFAGAWTHVLAAEDLGATVPPQFRKLLAEKMPSPR